MPRISRRRVLQALAGSAAVPFVSAPAAADSHGYGEGGYGAGAYGGQSGDETTSPDPEPTAEPAITQLEARDESNPRNPHCDAAITWRASIPEGTLAAATLDLTEADSGAVVRTWSSALSGQTAERSITEKVHHGGGTAYRVTLTVESGHDTETTAATTFTSP